MGFSNSTCPISFLSLSFFRMFWACAFSFFVVGRIHALTFLLFTIRFVFLFFFFREIDSFDLIF